ncbi:MAG: hypothetical protein ACTSUD_10685 [Alphaproteobacteria bacterium]
MPDTHMSGNAGAMTPARLWNYVSEQLDIGKTRGEIVEALVAQGIERETASDMVINSLDAQWRDEGGGGPALGRVGPRHMIAGALLIALGGAATAASYYSLVNFDVEVGYVFYGAVFGGAMEFVYGLIRYLD